MKLKYIIGLACFVFMANSAMAANRQFTPELLWAMGRVNSPCASPDGKSAVYTVSYYSVDENKSRTLIKQIATNGGEAKELCKGSSPKYIKGGDEIAYLANDKDGKSQLWKMSVDGSNQQQISFCEKDVEDYSFSPDESKVILIHSVASQLANYNSEKKTGLPKSSAYVTEDMMYRHWDEWAESIPHPFVADYDGTKVGSEVDLLEGEPYECPMKPFGGIEQLCWSPDSKQIAYTCRKKTGVDYSTSTDSDIYLYDISSKTTRNLCKPADYVAPKCDYSLSLADQPVNHQDGDFNVGYDTNPKFSSDGKYIAWQSMEHDGFESDRNRLCIYDVKSGAKNYVTEKFDSNVDDYIWAADNKSLYFIGVWHGTTHVYSTNLKGEVKQITEGQYDYNSLQLCGKSLLCGRQSMQEPTDLYLVSLGKKADVCQLTDENRDIKSQVDWGTVEPRWSKTVDGKDLLSWIILPPNFDKNKKYPTLLFCEGGPQSPVSQFWSFRWNMMIMAANGYVVVAPNRRGLPGFGSDWNNEISTNYGGHCMDDLLSAIDDAANNLPYVDRDRMGCVGASFGGFSVYYLAGHHQKRFKAFIAHDGIYNLEQQYVETEENWFTNWDLGGAPWKQTAPVSEVSSKQRAAIARSYAASPHKFVSEWDTPILCIHGSKDYRIVDSQAMAAFNAAKLRGIPAKLFICPDENHWVLKPQNGIMWQRTFFEWLDRYVKPGK